LIYRQLMSDYSYTKAECCRALLAIWQLDGTY